MFLMICFLMAGLGIANAQSRSVSGKVLSADADEPIIGASVVVKGTTTGTVTNVNGNFSINVPSVNATLVISYVGMKTVEVAASNNMVVKLESAAQELDEVLAVAYGTATKKSFTGSAEVIKADNISKHVVTAITKALDGQVAGVQSTLGSGQPGSGASIVVRGIGSINASSSPLYVVDGIPYSGSINAINPADIESISVLKDASAAALYGARGGNGVVLINTKKSTTTNDAVSINLRTNFGVSSRAVPAYKTLDQKQYLETVFQAYKNDAINSGTPPSQAGAVAIASMKGTTTGLLGVNEQYNPFNYKLAELIDPATGLVRSDATLNYNQNWMEEVLADNPMRQEYQLAFSGGSNKTKWNASLSYLNEEGILKTTSFDRYTGRLSVETQAKPWLKFGLSANYAKSKSNYGTDDTSSATSNVWYSVQMMAPIYPIYEIDANYQIINDATGKPKFDYGDNRPSGAQIKFNSIATLYNDRYYYNTDNLGSRTFVEIAPKGALDGLKFRMNLGIDNVNYYSTTYYNPLFGNAATVSGRLTKENYRMFSYTFNQLLTYEKKFNDHSLDLLLGHEAYSYLYNYLTAQKTGFPFAGLYELTAGSTIADADSYEHNYRIESYFSRLNYGFMDKYYLSGSFRTDASSRFNLANNWGNFWSAGASWRISQEAFMKELTWVDNMTLKASYGEQGNDAIGSYYAWQSLYNLGYPNANANGAIVTSVENKEVSWEKNQNFNIGLEFRMFNRLNGTLEYYNRKTVDMLLYKPMATSLGFDGVNTNIGSMQNSGVELTLSGDVIKTRDFKWNATIIGQTLNNKVLKLVDGKDITSGQQIIREGEPLYSFYMVKSAGIDPATGDRLFWFFKKDADGKKIEGSDYISSDVNSTSNYRQLCGSRIPMLQGSFNNAFTYKNFDLSSVMTFSIGGKVLDYQYQSFMNPMYVGQNYHVNILRAWKQPGDVTDVPRIVKGMTTVFSDQSLIDASYLSIKNITFGYTMDTKTLKSIGLRSLRIFASGENLGLFTHLDGMNPQSNFTGTSNYSYVANKVMSLGLDINF